MMTPFKIEFEAGNRVFRWDTGEFVICDIDQLNSLDDEQLAVYARSAKDVRNHLHKLASGVQLSPESEYALRTADWLAGQTSRELRRRQLERQIDEG